MIGTNATHRGGLALLLAILAAPALQVHAHGPSKAAHSDAAVVAPSPDERAAYEDALPALQKHCYRCHTTAGKKAKRKTLAHMNMDTYPFTGHHAHELGRVVRRVLGAGTKRSRPTMPSDARGAVAGDELETILKWADAFEANPARSAHKAHDSR
jgi:hypothetical protein